MTTGRSGAIPTAPRKQEPPWAAWLGPALGALAVILKATGQGIARGALVFCLVATPIIVFRLWSKTPRSRRPLLLYAPLTVAAALVVTFFVIPTGGPADDNEITPGVCRYGYTQQGDCLPAPGGAPAPANPGADPGACPNPAGHDSHGNVCPGTIAPGDD